MFPDQPDRSYFGGLIKVWNSYSEADKLVSIHTHFDQEFLNVETQAQAKEILDQELSTVHGNFDLVYCIHPSSIIIFNFSGIACSNKSIIIMGQNLPESPQLLDALIRLLDQELKELDDNCSPSPWRRHLSEYPFSLN